jgi:hypothetical protein
MSLIATLALAASASTATLPTCSWDRPGVNPFMGDVVAAVDRYQDIPQATREKLKARMKSRAYDEIAVISRDAITGKANYGADIREMHFGRGSVCTTVSRSKWTNQHQERGLVYCEDGQCLIVPTVCRNVSRITRLAPKPVAGAAQDEVVAAAPPVPPEAPLLFEPPAAGEAGPTVAPSFADTARIPTLNQTPGLAIPPMVTGGGTPPSFSPGGGVPPLPPGGGTPTNDPFPPGAPPPITTPIPEPATWFMMGLGLLALAWRRRQVSR